MGNKSSNERKKKSKLLFESMPPDKLFENNAKKNTKSELKSLKELEYPKITKEILDNENSNLVDFRESFKRKTKQTVLNISSGKLIK